MLAIVSKHSIRISGFKVRPKEDEKTRIDDINCDVQIGCTCFLSIVVRSNVSPGFDKGKGKPQNNHKLFLSEKGSNCPVKLQQNQLCLRHGVQLT